MILTTDFTEAQWSREKADYERMVSEFAKNEQWCDAAEQVANLLQPIRPNLHDYPSIYLATLQKNWAHYEFHEVALYEVESPYRDSYLNLCQAYVVLDDVRQTYNALTFGMIPENIGSFEQELLEAAHQTCAWHQKRLDVKIGF